jgi:beta-lactamase regulating signal transducer with metallopeptidase domain
MSFHDSLYRISSEAWPFAANHLWQSTLAGLLAMAAIVFLNKESARARYALWVLISLKFALPSAVLVAILGLNGMTLELFAAETSSARSSHTTGIGLFDIAGLTAHGQADLGHSEIYCLLSLVWLAGFLLVLTRWLQKRIEFSGLLRSSRVSPTDRELAALRLVTGWLRVRTDIELIVASEIGEPAAWRVFRPAIVLPENISGQLSDAELESVLMHEIIHIQRRDNLVANLQMLLCSIFWFHPLIWISDRKIHSERERACDQEVCLLGAQPAVYAASLLKVLRFCIGLRMAGVSNAIDSNLKRRIREIMNNQVEKRAFPLHRAFVVAVALAIVVFSVAAGVMSRDRVFLERGNKGQERIEGGDQGAAVRAGPLRGGGTTVGGSGAQDNFSVVMKMQSETVQEDLKNAADISLPFDNDDQSPVLITEAQMKAVRDSSVYKRQGDNLVYWAELYVVNASITLFNNSSRRVKNISLVFSCGEAGSVGYPTELRIEPGATVKLAQTRWSGLGDPSSFSLKVGEVLFEDGDRWPKFLPNGTPTTAPLPPPPPPKQDKVGSPGTTAAARDARANPYR